MQQFGFRKCLSAFSGTTPAVEPWLLMAILACIGMPHAMSLQCHNLTCQPWRLAKFEVHSYGTLASLKCTAMAPWQFEWQSHDNLASLTSTRQGTLESLKCTAMAGWQ